ncbi:MAG: MFS transporter [Geminicoccaceae bacterium]
MDRTADSASTRLATRLAFFAAGFGMAGWAPLVPFAKANVGVDDGRLGLLLLCLGIGSIVAMPATGWFSARIGSRPMILAGGLGLVLLLPLLATTTHALVLAAALLAFGASLGTIDVAMNVHGIEVERAAGRPLMSGFHGLFSVGGLAGSGGVTAVLATGATPLVAALVASAVALLALALAWPRLLRARGGEAMPFAAPRGVVLVLAFLAGITFLFEGAILDWGALLVVARDLVAQPRAGIAYVLFAVAMATGRLTGDRIVTAFGSERVLLLGGLLTVAGFVVLLTVPWPPLALAGFILVGLGASNIVPVLVSLTGQQTAMPAGLAVAAVTTTGYAGILAGPALIGFAAHATSLPTAFWLLAALAALVPLLARPAVRV